MLINIPERIRKFFKWLEPGVWDIDYEVDVKDINLQAAGNFFETKSFRKFKEGKDKLVVHRCGKYSRLISRLEGY